MKTTVWYLLVICLIKVKEMVNYIFAVKCSIEFYMRLFSALAAAAPDSGRLAPASTTPVNQLRCKRDIFLYDVN